MRELTRTYPLHGIDESAGPGNRPASSGVTIAERCDIETWQVLARRYQSDAVANALGISATPGRVTLDYRFTALPLAPGYWMLLTSNGKSLMHEINTRVDGLAYVSDQSHARVVLRLSGPKARTVLSKGCRLDLDGEIFATDSCAQTSIAEVSTLIHRVDDAPSYDLIVPSGYACAFWHWLVMSAGGV
ncbi:MAG: hypothetical protein HY308_17440 [Gammaproteobacteria bacterium]|nr:hypothetical protein [Gammaproteobacteria bacterium]